MDDSEPPRPDDFHDQLLAAFKSYYDMNLRWTKTGYKSSGKEIRQILLQIEGLSRKRRKVVNKWKYEFEAEARIYAEMMYKRQLAAESKQNDS
jgi:hypothetical protein